MVNDNNLERLIILKDRLNIMIENIIAIQFVLTVFYTLDSRFIKKR